MKAKISPINGQPVPRGRQFTPETAREARQRRTEKERREKSIRAAFLAMLEEPFADQETGAEAVAAAILSGAARGDPRLVTVALELCDENERREAEQVQADDPLSASLKALAAELEARKE